MSISGKLAEALMLTNALKSRKLMTTDFPINKSFHPKAVEIVCRRCEGNGTEKDETQKCTQCGGRGAEKLSLKAYNRALRKEQKEVAVKTQPKPTEPA